jgi:hypothetical protein
MAHLMQASEEGSPAKYKPNCPAWPKPYAEDLLETDRERLLKIWVATEIAVFPRPWELATDQDASVFFAPELRPGGQFGREACRSENIESFKTPLSEEL